MTSIAGTEDRSTRTKPFLGGWRSKVTGLVYWNTCTQTGEKNVGREEKTVQTDFMIDKYTGTQHDAGVQVNFLPDVRDRLLAASDHSQDWSSKDPEAEKIAESVVKIQRFYRACRARRTRNRSPSVPTSAKNIDQPETRAEEPCPYRSQDFSILNRTSPRTRMDFELLYNLLDRWRIRETERTSEQHPFDPSRIALCSLILSKEVELLRAIDAMKTGVKLSRKGRTYRRFLDELSKSAVWRNSHGEQILVDTARVRRARSFRDAFDALSREDVSIEERVKVLTRLRRDIEPHTCRSSGDLIRLLDQEIDLLTRNVDESKLNWLRSRLKMVFLRLARDALRNDLDDGLGCSSSRRTICKSCGRLLPVEKFPKEKRRRSTSCNYCLYVKIRTGPMVVYGSYERLLRDVRRQEARMHCYTSLAFVIDEKLVYRLVNDIWHGKSAISEDDSLDELRLARFRRELEWSPWNCLLLTAREASLHRKVDDLEKFYGPTMLQKFHTKNLQAKVQFQSVIEYKGITTGEKSRR